MILVGRFAACAVVMSLVACGRGENGAFTGGPSTLAGAPAVSYDVKRVDGTPDSLAARRGSIVVMNLWATWCPPCQEEMPALERFSRAYRSRGVVVLGIDQGESARTAAAYAKDHGVTFPILADEDQRYGGTYKSVGLPTTFVISRDGKIVRGIDREVTEAQLSALVDPLLAAK
jgi:peroxiredoxin